MAGFNPVEKDLYKLLGVEKSAPQAEVKKAYHRLAIKLHPDKNPGDEAAKENFQTLQRVYAVLGDPEKRKVYDDTGSLIDSEELTSDAFSSLYAYYRDVFPKFTEDDIDSFESGYRGSAAERADLLHEYSRFGGNMNKVFEWLICSRPEVDSHRFMDIIEEAAAAGEVKKSRSYERWAAGVADRPRPKDPLAPRRKATKKAGGDQQALVAAIRARGSSAVDGLLASLEAKYGGGGKEGRGKKKGKGGPRGGGKAGPSKDDVCGEADENEAAEATNQREPTEDEFQAAAMRLGAARGGGVGGGAKGKAKGKGKVAGQPSKRSKAV